jgi:phytoene synthase
MELYTDTSYKLAAVVTQQYSTSFSTSSRLFNASVKKHIYAVYALVRIADEVVDAYRGRDARERLDALETETMAAIKTGYSTNPLIHAFAHTAREYGIGKTLVSPFFESMRTDLTATTFTQQEYARYIYGSAEVVGLMCLKIFTQDAEQYRQLKPAACALGAAYQKVNFLRDMRADWEQLHRVYFPGVAFDTFDDQQKAAIIADIEDDFDRALPAVAKLPKQTRTAVNLSYTYYTSLLATLKKASAAEIKQHRFRVKGSKKVLLYVRAKAGV